MAKVLVTGANGAAGRHIVSALIARGHDVCGVYRSTPGSHPGVTWRQADLTQPDGIAALLEGCEAVIHLAAELTQRSLMDSINIDATTRLVALCEGSGVRYFGHASSIVVYGSPRSRAVNEDTPRIDLNAPLSKQYYAEPYMLDYARTKVAGEIAIEAIKPRMIVDFYRPGVVVTEADLLNCGDWSRLRRIFAAYRQTQFITAADTAAAIAHLMERGLAASGEQRRPIEAYNIVDHTAGTYRSLFSRAYKISKDSRFKVPTEVPILLDMAKDVLRFRTLQLRYPLGMIRFSGVKLRNTGFAPVVGIDNAIDAAIANWSKTLH